MKYRSCRMVIAMAALAVPALAAPPGVTEREGAWMSPAGKALYTFGRDEAGASNCNDACATAWPPLLAADGAVADADWSIVDRADGTHMWAYKGRPVYTYARDKAGEPPTGVSATWPLAKK